MILAALYVQTDGAYFGIPGLDPWDEPRDARTKDLPHPSHSGTYCFPSRLVYPIPDDAGRAVVAPILRGLGI